MALAITLSLAVAGQAAAQLAGGNIYGRVSDDSGAALPGAAVTLTGSQTGSRTTTSGPAGEFRFLNLDPGVYKVTAALPGFADSARELRVSTGANVDAEFRLKVKQLQESVTVSAETPVLDHKRTGTATSFTLDELQRIPNSRDPWALLRTVPGVVMDRVNIAGNESGQQSNFVAKGANRADAVWNLDGVNITDMAATGASPTYFDQDAFEEIQISTGGNDIRIQTGGVGLNFVTKRGGNSLRGTARGFFTHDALEASNVPAELTALGVTPDTADHNEQIADYGIDVGGPIVKDKLWFWGAYAKQDIRLARSAGKLIDKTLLVDMNAKLNWQATSKDMVSLLWFWGKKQKFGRLTGAQPVEADSATWNQDDNWPEGLPPGLWKIEDNHVFGRNLFVSAKYAHYGTGFKLDPRGGLDQPAGSSTRLGQTFGSWLGQYFLRPQDTANLDGSYFANGTGGNHEIRFGAGYRRAQSTTQLVWPGQMLLALDNSATDRRVRIFREGLAKDRTEYLSFYLGDTFVRGRVTLNLGLRYDRQWGAALESQMRGNPAFPQLVPGISFSGYEAPFKWNDLTPRVGVTYVLGESRKTQVRASFARYASQLAIGDVNFASPGAAAGFVDYRWNDRNGDHLAQTGEVLFDQGRLAQGGGFDPANPTAVTSPNRIDASLQAPLATEMIVGLDRELLPNLAVAASYTYRRNTRQLWLPRLGMTAADYQPGAALTGVLPGGASYNVQTFVPNAALVAAHGGGRIRANRPDFLDSFGGAEVAIVKRLASRWMGRLAASYNNHREFYDAAVPQVGGLNAGAGGNLTRLDTDALISGGVSAARSAGSGAGDVFINSKWTLNANALYELPWGLEIAANVFGKQGTPLPIFRATALGQDGSQRVLISPETDTYRFANLWNMDLRLAKAVKAGRTGMTLSADLFNVWNANTELNRNRNADSPAFRRLSQNLSPRILRLGVRMTF
jgi:hypothetical protein